MIYTRYAIEVIVQIGVIFDSSLIPSLSHDNSFKYEINNARIYMNNTMYMDDFGLLDTSLFFYYTYEKALYFLDKYCQDIKTKNFITSIKIVEVLDNTPLPLMEARKIKLKKLLCSEKK